MAVVFDEIQATIEPPPPAEPPPTTPPVTRNKPQPPLEQQLRFVHERQARLRAD